MDKIKKIENILGTLFKMLSRGDTAGCAEMLLPASAAPCSLLPAKINKIDIMSGPVAPWKEQAAASSYQVVAAGIWSVSEMAGKKETLNLEDMYG
jgi:aspartate ammonia-lyase